MELVQLTDGLRLGVRPITGADAPALVAGFARLSPRSRYLRFHAPRTGLSPEEVRWLTEVDGRDHVALAAFDGRKMVAVARFVRSRAAPDTAEFALVVDDLLQQRGIATLLLDRLRQAALDLGVVRFTGQVLEENEAMLELLRKLHARVGLPSLGVREASLLLS